MLTMDVTGMVGMMETAVAADVAHWAGAEPVTGKRNAPRTSRSQAQ